MRVIMYHLVLSSKTSTELPLVSTGLAALALNSDLRDTSVIWGEEAL
jgi:hypothetical protein